MTTLYDLLLDIQSTFGIRVCVHDISGITFTSQMLKLPYEWESHHCAYCLSVKNALGLDVCMGQKALALRLLRRNGMKPYEGVCLAGMCEYILPVECTGRLRAVVFASGIDRARAAECRQKLERRLARANLHNEDVLAEFDRLSGRALTTRDNLRFFAELTRDFLLRYMGGSLAQSSEENQALPVAALAHSRSDRTAAVLAYIDENYASQITLRRLADVFYMSEGHLSRSFHRDIGMSVVQYIRKRRMDVAATKLAMTEDTVAQVAEAVGMEDSNYFCRVFHSLMGMTPNSYRKMHKKNLRDENP